MKLGPLRTQFKRRTRSQAQAEDDPLRRRTRAQGLDSLHIDMTAVL